MLMVTKLPVPVNDNSDKLDCSHFLWGVIKRRQGKKQTKKTLEAPFQADSR